MSGQSREFDDLLHQRITVVQELAVANAEHHRLLQLTGGADFLALMRGKELDEVDGHEVALTELETNQALMDALHVKLDRIDQALAEMKTNGKCHE
ncbi:MAG: hypothetical protein AAGA50_23820 [Pseudomonadota bacterium]